MVRSAKRPKKASRPAPALIATCRALAIPELLLEIFGHLDQVSLTHTSLVNKDWLIQSRQVLYHSPDVSSLHALFAPHIAWLLFRTISARPELGQIVRGLTLRANDELGQADYDAGVGDESKELLTLRGILAVCTRLDQITFARASLSVDRALDLVADLRPELRALAIDFRDCYSVSPLIGARLSRFSRLRHLALRNFGGETDFVASADYAKPSYSLTSLELSPAEVLSLGNDTADPAEYGQAELDWFLGDSRGSLRHLTLAIVDPAVIATTPAWAPNLQSFKLEVSRELRGASGLCGLYKEAGRTIPRVRFAAEWVAWTDPWGEVVAADEPSAVEQADPEEESEVEWEGEDMGDGRSADSGFDWSSDSGESMDDDGSVQTEADSPVDLDRWDDYHAQIEWDAQASDDDTEAGSESGEDEDSRKDSFGFVGGSGLVGWDESSGGEDEEWKTWPAGVNAEGWQGEEGWLSGDDLGWGG